MAKLNPHLNFKDNAREAIEFYKSVFGGKLTISTFGEAGMSVEDNEKDLVMHSQLDADNGFTLMASDTPSHITPSEGKIGNISISGDEEDELKGYWDKLAEGAKISQPLEKAPWGDTFGMLTDKFGVEWMVNIAGKKE
jgi:PhnB protein